MLTTFIRPDAPLYMDIITIYFALLPLLMFFAIRFAVKKEYDKHFKAQLSLFILTLIVVLFFEVSVRLSGGFTLFMKTAHVSYSFMLIFLMVHIAIALATVVTWSALLYGAIKSYKIEGRAISKSHKKIGRYVFVGASITSLMGVIIYYLLFVY